VTLGPPPTRRLILAAAGAALPLPFGARAQQKPLPVIGYLSGSSAGPSATFWPRSAKG